MFVGFGGVVLHLNETLFIRASVTVRLSPERATVARKKKSYLEPLVEKGGGGRGGERAERGRLHPSILPALRVNEHDVIHPPTPALLIGIFKRPVHSHLSPPGGGWGVGVFLP